MPENKHDSTEDDSAASSPFRLDDIDTLFDSDSPPRSPPPHSDHHDQAPANPADVQTIRNDHNQYNGSGSHFVSHRHVHRRSLSANGSQRSSAERIDASVRHLPMFLDHDQKQAPAIVPSRQRRGRNGSQSARANPDLSALGDIGSLERYNSQQSLYEDEDDDDIDPNPTNGSGDRSTRRHGRASRPQSARARTTPQQPSAYAQPAQHHAQSTGIQADAHAIRRDDDRSDRKHTAHMRHMRDEYQRPNRRLSMRRDRQPPPHGRRGSQSARSADPDSTAGTQFSLDKLPPPAVLPRHRSVDSMRSPTKHTRPHRIGQSQTPSSRWSSSRVAEPLSNGSNSASVPDTPKRPHYRRQRTVPSPQTRRRVFTTQKIDTPKGRQLGGNEALRSCRAKTPSQTRSSFSFNPDYIAELETIDDEKREHIIVPPSKVGPRSDDGSPIPALPPNRPSIDLASPQTSPRRHENTPRQVGFHANRSAEPVPHTLPKRRSVELTPTHTSPKRHRSRSRNGGDDFSADRSAQPEPIDDEKHTDDIAKPNHKARHQRNLSFRRDFNRQSEWYAYKYVSPALVKRVKEKHKRKVSQLDAIEAGIAEFQIHDKAKARDLKRKIAAQIMKDINPNDRSGKASWNSEEEPTSTLASTTWVKAYINVLHRSMAPTKAHEATDDEIAQICIRYFPVLSEPEPEPEPEPGISESEPEPTAQQLPTTARKSEKLKAELKGKDAKAELARTQKKQDKNTAAKKSSQARAKGKPKARDADSIATPTSKALSPPKAAKANGKKKKKARPSDAGSAVGTKIKASRESGTRKSKSSNTAAASKAKAKAKEKVSKRPKAQQQKMVAPSKSELKTRPKAERTNKTVVGKATPRKHMPMSSRSKSALARERKRLAEDQKRMAKEKSKDKAKAKKVSKRSRAQQKMDSSSKFESKNERPAKPKSKAQRKTKTAKTSPAPLGRQQSYTRSSMLSDEQKNSKLKRLNKSSKKSGKLAMAPTHSQAKADINQAKSVKLKKARGAELPKSLQRVLRGVPSKTRDQIGNAWQTELEQEQERMASEKKKHKKEMEKERKRMAAEKAEVAKAQQQIAAAEQRLKQDEAEFRRRALHISEKEKKHQQVRQQTLKRNVQLTEGEAQMQREQQRLKRAQERAEEDRAHANALRDEMSDRIRRELEAVEQGNAVTAATKHQSADGVFQADPLLDKIGQSRRKDEMLNDDFKEKMDAYKEAKEQIRMEQQAILEQMANEVPLEDQPREATRTAVQMSVDRNDVDMDEKLTDLEDEQHQHINSACELPDLMLKQQESMDMNVRVDMRDRQKLLEELAMKNEEIEKLKAQCTAATTASSRTAAMPCSDTNDADSAAIEAHGPNNSAIKPAISSDAAVPAPVPAPAPAPLPVSVPAPAPLPVLGSAPTPAAALIPAPLPAPLPGIAPAPLPASAPIPAAAPLPGAAPLPSAAPLPGAAPLPSAAPLPDVAPLPGVSVSAAAPIPNGSLTAPAPAPLPPPGLLAPPLPGGMAPAPSPSPSPVPPPFGMPGIPALPGVGGTQTSQMPKKKEMKAGKKMKPWHWKPVRDPRGTIWEELTEMEDEIVEKIEHTVFRSKPAGDEKHDDNDADDDDGDDDEKMNIGRVEDLFAAKVAKKGKGKGNKKKKKKGDDEAKKVEKGSISFVSSKRTRQFGLTRVKVKMDNSTILRAVLNMNEDVLDEESLDVLINLVPTPEEMAELCKVFPDDGDEAELARCERFFNKFRNVSNIKQRLKAWKTKRSFNERYDDVMDKINTLTHITMAIGNSKAWQRTLATILSFGNFLNGGTKKGQKHGFLLDSLGKLIGMKAKDDTTSTLAYLYKYSRANDPQMLDWIEEFDTLPAVLRIDREALEALVIDIERLQIELVNIKKLLLSSTASDDDETKEDGDEEIDRFKTIMHEWYDDAFVRAQSLSDQLNDAVELVMALAEFYAEKVNYDKADEFEMETFFGYFHDFRDDLIKERKTVQEKENKEDMARKREKREREQKAKRKELRAAKSAKGKSAKSKIRKFKKERRAVDLVVNMSVNADEKAAVAEYRSERNKHNRSTSKHIGTSAFSADELQSEHEIDTVAMGNQRSSTQTKPKPKKSAKDLLNERKYKKKTREK